jgi:hypothetical protein
MMLLHKGLLPWKLLPHWALKTRVQFHREKPPEQGFSDPPRGPEKQPKPALLVYGGAKSGEW